MNWELYLSRPFDLLATSIWNEWYASPKFEALFGIRFQNALFIESPRGISCHYRPKGDLALLRNAVRSVVLDKPDRMLEIFQRAIDLNTQAKAMLAGTQTVDILELLEFLIDLSLHATIFPFFAGVTLADADSSHTRAKEMCEQLRSMSYYPEVFSKKLIPAIEQLMTGGYTKADAHLLTIREVFANDFTPIKSRSQVSASNYFILKELNGAERVSYTDNPLAVIDEIQGAVKHNASQAIKGLTAFPGVVKGRVRIVLDNNPNTPFEFDEVLVAISTNPVLAPLMHKALAFVTDEGGITCHAAIVARELKKPCIIGTKFATKVFKDGDMVEVDADKGIVRKL